MKKAEKFINITTRQLRWKLSYTDKKTHNNNNNNNPKIGELFPETTAFMIANKYRKHIWKDSNITNAISRKYLEESETIRPTRGARRALAQGDCTHRHNQVANAVHQELPIKCGLWKGSPMPYGKYDQ
jgi:hypothetical protein